MSVTFLTNEDKEEFAKEYVKNSLYGKKVSFNGDSICAGANTDISFLGGYGKIIAERNNMVYENIAKGGATITAEVYTSTGVARTWICRTIENMSADADYIIVQGGGNDSSNAAPMGALSDGYDAELDDTTYYGAFESMLKQLVTKYAGKKVGYIASHKWSADYKSTNGDDYYSAALECCEKWGVPVCDLNISVPPFREGFEELLAYAPDGVHPNEAGYKAYFCDQIEAFMRSMAATGKSPKPSIMAHSNNPSAHQDIRDLIADLKNEVAGLRVRVTTAEELLEIFSASLPNGYQRVEYVGSDGNQYIDTGLVASDYSDGLNYKINCAITDTTTSYLMGCLNSSVRSCNITVDTNKLSIACGGNNSSILVGGFELNQNITVDIFNATATAPNDMTAKINGADFLVGYEGTASAMPNASIYFLKCNGSSRVGAICNVYGFDVYKSDGTPLRKFVPCYRIADGVIGFYDTVNSVFYPNTGSGAFIKGTDI